MLSVKSNLQKYNSKNSSSYKVLGVYCLPESWKSISLISQELKNLNINFYTAFIVPTNALVFKSSCHICQINYKHIYGHEYYLSLTVQNDDMEEVIRKLKIFSPDINTSLICQSNLRSDLACPLIIEQQKERIEILEQLLNIIENYFSDDEIYKHKDILVSMNSNGWVPLTIIENKLEQLIIINVKEIAGKLKGSQFLQLDTTENYVKRINVSLPFSVEHKQVVVIDIPDTIKSVRQLPTYLQLDNNSNVDYFEYSIHAAIVTLQSREDAIKLVEEVKISGKMKAKLLVPSLSENESSNVILSLSDVIDVDKVLASLALKQEPLEQIHIMRLSPNDLTYSFKDGFVSPDQSTIDKIVKQCNFYFSDANVLKDLFILKKIKSNPGGWIDLNIIAKFKQIVKFSDDNIDNVVYAMCSSDQVQISRDGKSLRRRLPLPEWDPSIYIRSLFLWNMPRICDSYEKLDQVFRDEGRFIVKVSRYIRSDRNIPADLRKLVDKIPALGKHNCGVVEFNTREAMLSAEQFIHLKWAAVKTFYLDTKEELPKPAVIVGKSSKFLPPPIPVSTFIDDRVAPLQAGTRIDPRFWQVARLLSAKKRHEMKIYTNDCENGVSRPENDAKLNKFNINNNLEFPPLGANNKKTNYKKKSPLQPINNNSKTIKDKFLKNNNENFENKAKPAKKFRRNGPKSKPKIVVNSENFDSGFVV